MCCIHNVINSISFNPEFGHENFTFNKNNYRDYYVESVMCNGVNDTMVVDDGNDLDSMFKIWM